MESSKSYFVKPNYLGQINGVGVIGTDSMFEFEESDMWNVSVELRKTVPSPRIAKRALVKRGEVGGTARVSVPDWSKILKGNEEEDHMSVDDWIPPHEMLAKRRNESFSVREGIGRTLKGRDLRRVRNAVWEITGFED